MQQDEKAIFEEARTILFNEYDVEISGVETEIHKLKLDNAKELLKLDIKKASDEQYSKVNNDFSTELKTLEKKLKDLKNERIKLERVEI